jgi:serine/threonine protein kinase
MIVINSQFFLILYFDYILIYDGDDDDDYLVAPEIIHEGSSFNSDIWALGCTIIEMVTGKPPLFDLAPEAAIFHVASGNIPPFPSNISPVCIL